MVPPTSATASPKIRPLREGMFELPGKIGDAVELLGNRCADCGESFFPARHYCANCSSANLKRKLFGPAGEVSSFTIVRQSLPGAAIKAPYAIVDVRFQGGVSAQTVLVDAATEEAAIGMPVITTVRSVEETDEGETIVSYFVRPRAKEES